MKKTPRAAQPISLVPRKYAFRVQPQTSPNRSDWQSSALKTIDSNRQIMANTVMLSTMKKDLSTVKQDVERLFAEDKEVENRLSHKLELQTLKDELAHCRQVEQELRKELKECNQRLKQQPQDRYKSSREKDIINERLQKLEHQLLEAHQSTQLKEDVKAQKIQTLSQELHEAVEERNYLRDECGRLQFQVEGLTRPKVDQETQENEDEVLDVRRRMHEVEKEKLFMAARLKEKEIELRRCIEQTSAAMREKDAKYSSCLNEFKKLESKLGRSREEPTAVLRVRLEEVEQELFNTRQAGECLKNENSELALKVDRLRQQYEEQRHLNEEMAGKVRNLHHEISQAHRHDLAQYERKIQHLQAAYSELQHLYDQKCREQQQNHERARSQTISHPSNDELHKTKVQVLTLEIQVNQLHGELHRQRQESKRLDELNHQKDNYIRELEKQRELMEHQPNNEIEARCRQLYEDQQRIVEDYEKRVLSLEVQLERKCSEVAQFSSEAEGYRNQQASAPSFDTALKQHITENEQLRAQLKTKQEELLALRMQVDESRRRADSIRSQTQLDKLRGLTEQKTLKSHYEILLQNTKSELQSQKRKFQGLQRKADFRGEQLRKKDEFIQQVIISKVRPADQSQSDYLRKELQRFFSANYEARVISLQEQLAQLQPTEQ